MPSPRSSSAVAPEVCASDPASPVAGPVDLSAKRLHEVACEAFRVGNRGRLSLCEALRVLSETNLYLELGFPSLAAYAGTFFHLRRAAAFEYVRVARALVELTDLREAFARGEIGWVVLKAITRVASVESQAEWIEYVCRNGVESTLAEARDALRHRRDAPRESSYGLPNLDEKLVLRFSRYDMEKVWRWIGDASAAVAELTGAEEVEVEQAILFLCEKDAAGGATSSESRAQIVYHRCPDCRRARLGTPDGFVEVDSEEVERYEGSSEPVVIDGPTPHRLRRQILGREAGRCGNPRCHHAADHCHHIVFRSSGGKTDLENEVAVCTTCHALIHAGLLRVSADADSKASWRPAVSDRVLACGVESDRDVADLLPVLRLEPRMPAAESTHKSTDVDSGTANDDVDVEAIAHGLMRLGVPARRSREIVSAVVAALPQEDLTEANVLRQAVASI